MATKQKIMVVEDEIVVAMDIKNSLASWGYEVTGPVPSGEDAVEVARAGNPDLILMDIHLKGEIDGIDTAIKIHSELDIPVIFLTAHTDDQLVDRSKASAPYGYLVKPFEDRELQIAIELALYKHGMEQKLQKAREALEEANRELEKRVRQRTAELELKKISLEEVNTALQVLLKKREEDKKKLQKQVMSNIQELVDPYLGKLRDTTLDARQHAFVDILESNLADIVSPFSRNLATREFNLTPAELQVANLVKQGRTTKDIAKLLNLSSRTVESHRRNIRIKLDLKNKKTNLRTYLMSIE